MGSIKRRLVVNFMFIIVITVIILESLLLTNIRQQFYRNLEGSLLSQIQLSADLYTRYFSHATLEENVLNNVDTYWKQSMAQVEIINMEGELLMDSIGVANPEVGQMEDVQKALQGQWASWNGYVSYDTERVMAVSHPLYSGDRQVGVLRFVASLKEVNHEVQRMAYVFFWLGAMVTLITGVVSLFLANSITGPLKEVTAAAEKMAKGEYRTFIKKKKDDEIGRLSDTLNNMAMEILKKDQLKNDFISSVSHELRTPLTSIKGWAITLKQDPGDQALLNDGLEIIEAESDRLTLMVEELLDFSRFVSGKMTLQMKETDLNQVLEQVKKQMTPRGNREQVQFVVNVEPLPLVYTDENRLKQVLINLLDNAFKFTPAGGQVTMEAWAKDGTLTIVVKDTGCGIHPEELPKVKEKFYKGKSSKSQNGIGLSICDEIIKMMEGTFTIESQLEVGTEVTIAIPLQEVK